MGFLICNNYFDLLTDPMCEKTIADLLFYSYSYSYKIVETTRLLKMIISTYTERQSLGLWSGTSLLRFAILLHIAFFHSLTAERENWCFES